LLAAAGAFGLIAYQLGHPPPHAVEAAKPAPPPTASYLVTTHPMPPGTLARNDDFTVKTVPVDQLPPGVILDSPAARADLRGALLRRYLESGAPLLTNDLMRPRERGFLAAVLAPGTRAVSIAVDPVTGVAGLIWPGDRVDVILTQGFDRADSNGRVNHVVTSETVLTDVRVIAVDQDIAQGAPSNGGAAGKLASTVTVQATTNQAEKLAVATQLGHLSLAVRSATDDAKVSAVDPQGVSGADVSPARMRAGETVGSTVQVIQGDQRGAVTFR
jgi:pilus assembly protein CpaB